MRLWQSGKPQQDDCSDSIELESLVGRPGASQHSRAMPSPAAARSGDASVLGKAKRGVMHARAATKVIYTTGKCFCPSTATCAALWHRTRGQQGGQGGTSQPAATVWCV